MTVIRVKISGFCIFMQLNMHEARPVKGKKNMLEEIAKQAPPLNLLDHGPRDAGRLRTAAKFKRLADLWRLDANFRAAYRLDPEKTLADTGLDIEPEAFRLYLNPGETEKLLRGIREGGRGADTLPESFLLYYRALWEGQQRHKQMREKHLVPDEPRFRAWRARQERRLRLQLGRAAADSMIQPPLAFELSDGCSVGCPFCGLSAKRLRGIFRHTGENAALWRETLSRMHALIGSAAGFGLCYYATEPLDNPDYEKFLDDWYREFGTVPLTTTAVSVRDLERTRALLRYNDEKGCYYYRLSVLSPAMRDTLLAAFTPEELLRVFLQPQFPEAPGNNFTKAGRSRDENEKDAVGSTISCVSGFVVNMQEKTVRLETPFVSDRDHPTGEWFLEKCAFTTAADLEAKIRRMIDRYMPGELDLKKLCGSSCDFRLEDAVGSVRVLARGGSMVLLEDPMEQAALDTLGDALRERRYTGRELLDLLSERTDAIRSFFLLSMLRHQGLVDQIAD